MSDEPSEEQKTELVQQYLSITACELEREQVLEILQLHDWSLDRALATFFSADEPTTPEEPSWEPLLNDQRAPRSRRTGARTPSPPGRRPPVAPIAAPVSRLEQALNWLTDAPVRRTGPFSDLFRSIVRDSVAVAPEFSPLSFAQALAQVTGARDTVLCAYLHSPLHPLSREFCVQVLCDPSVVSALSRAVLWGGSVEEADGYEAAELLQIVGFPCLAVVANKQGKATVLQRLYYPGPGLARRLTDAITSARTPPAAAREGEERRRLISEQDSALAQAIEQDRARQQQREAERAAAELAEQQRLVDERREAEARQQALRDKRERLPPEPPAKTPNVTTVRVQLPDGARLQRRFVGSDKLQAVRDFVDVHLADKGVLGLNYVLESNFPKLRYEDPERSLSDAGLVPQAVLFLQDLDA